MPATATFASPPANGFELVEFLKRELKPTPNRWRSTIRLTLACLAATIPIMAFHLRQPVIVMLVMFLLVSEDRTSTLLGSIVAVGGLTIGCGALLLFYICAVDLPWLRVFCVPLFIATGLFINRVVTLGPLGTAIAIPLAIGMVIPEIAPDPEFLCRFPFYLWWAALLGLTVNYAGHLLLNQNTSQSVLLRALVLRIEAAENSLRDLAAGKTNPAHASALFNFALEGIAEPMHLLALTAKIEPCLKEHQSELRARLILIDRLIEAAALIEDQKQPQFPEAIRQCFLALAETCARWKTAIIENKPFVLADKTAAIEAIETLPSLLEMERIVRLMPLTFDEKKLPEELQDTAPKKPAGLIVPDAFTNPEYVQFAIKGALAGLICYLFFTSVKYEGIDTAITTCIVCSVATLGASIQKGALRLAGAAIGGTAGIITLVYFFPHFDSLGGFWFPVAAASALAAYINFGSPRISYCGLQIGYAFYNCVLQGYGPETELKVVRDRLIGIALGLFVYHLINRNLWPVKALNKAEEKLAVVLQELAILAALPDENEDPAPQLAAAHRLRLQIVQDLATVRQLLESSKFEPNNDRREYLDEIKNNAQRLFLRLLAVIQHRADLRPQMAPEPLRSASLRFRITLSRLLLKKAGQRGNDASQPAPDLKVALTGLEQTISKETAEQTDRPHNAKIEARLALYQECVPILINMAELRE